MFFDIIKENEVFFIGYLSSLVFLSLVGYLMHKRFNHEAEPYVRPAGILYLFIFVQLMLLIILFVSVKYNLFAVSYFSPFFILFLLGFFYFVDSIIFYNDYESKGTFVYFIFKAILFFGYGLAGIFQMNNLVGLGGTF